MPGRRLIIILIICLLPGKGINQENMQANMKDRQPAVAGSFYPADPAALRKMIEGAFAAAKPVQTNGLVRALVVPHAGYIFSGQVAASGYNQLDPESDYDRVFILASSHKVSFGKASVYTQGDYITPLGKVAVDRETGAALIAASEVFTDYPEAHAGEHSIEVQLPFLQMKLKKPFKIVPIVLGTQVPSVCRQIAEALEPWFRPGNLFIVSADFSHYPSYSDAVKVDDATASAFCGNNPDAFLKTLKNNDRLDIPELATSMCAWPSGLTLLYLTQNNSSLVFKRIDYMNSGDIRGYGDKAGVVGYHAISISGPQPDGFRLSGEEKRELLEIARNTINAYTRTRTVPQIQASGFGESLKTRAGAFVTLKINGELRGCIGTFEPQAPLYKVIQEMAVASSSRDGRFSPVREDELASIHIEISVLTPMQKIKDISEIRLGKHGIYIKKGYQSGTFLPQVATETGWTLEEFLGHCSRDKAGLGWTGWKDADIYIYEALIFEEDFPKKK
jgi:AmmeMemoRadiSam system protein B/AmmeMemoRadiSam system protein A